MSRPRPVKVHFYEWFVDAWLTSECRDRLNASGRGIYRELLDHCYVDGTFPDDPAWICRKCACTPKALRKVWPVISEKFYLKDGRRGNLAADKSRSEFIEYADKQRWFAIDGWQRRKTGAHKANEMSKREMATHRVASGYPKAEKDHHQEKEEEIAAADSDSGGRRDGSSFQPKPKSDLRSDDDENQNQPPEREPHAGNSRQNGSQPQNQNPTQDEKTKTQPSARSEAADPEVEFRERMWERHGAKVDADKLLEQVTHDLGDVSLTEFLAADLTQTTAPSSLTNPAGHYRKLARRLRRAKGGSAVEAALNASVRAQALKNISDGFQPPTCCGGKGKLPNGEYCSCATGKFAAELESRKSA